MGNHPLFRDMEFSDDPEQLKKWISLMMNKRTTNEPIAATKIDSGTDVNFGLITRKINKSVQIKRSYAKGSNNN